MKSFPLGLGSVIGQKHTYKMPKSSELSTESLDLKEKKKEFLDSVGHHFGQEDLG